MKIPKASWDALRMIKLGFMGLSMVSVPLFVKPVFVGTYAFLSMAIPRVRETLSAWLTPAFLYVILNCIIVAIVANSGAGIFTATGAASRQAEGCSPPPDLQEKEEKPKPGPIVREYTDESRAVERRSETTPMPAVAEADTLEATWNAIAEASRPPPARHLRKADTWQTRRPLPPDSAALGPYSRFGKSETWNSGRNLDRETLGAEMLRKEPSLGQDELNKRVEAFIAKVNHDIKLQREESLLHHMEMLDRGSR